MKTTDAATAGELEVLKRPAIGPRRGIVIDDATAQARRQSVLANGIDQIHEQYRRRVYSWCLRIVRNVEDAEDLTQDAFLLLCRKINTYRGESAFSTWLYRLVTNIALMRMRKKIPAQTPLDDILETRKGAINPCRELKTSVRAMAASVARVDLERMFVQMPSGYRKAFFLHDSEDYSHPEIAVITGWSIGTSKSQLHRARRHLRKLLECGHEKAGHTSRGSSVSPGKNARPGRQPPPNSGANSSK